MCSEGTCVGCRYVSHAGADRQWKTVRDIAGANTGSSKEPESAAPGLDELLSLDDEERLAPGAGSSSSGLVPEHLEFLDAALDLVRETMLERGRKYGPGNIQEFGELGVLVRLSDKLARLRHTTETFGDETSSDSWLDCIGYSIIGWAWCNGLWPGSEQPPV